MDYLGNDHADPSHARCLVLLVKEGKHPHLFANFCATLGLDLRVLAVVVKDESAVVLRGRAQLSEPREPAGVLFVFSDLDAHIGSPNHHLLLRTEKQKLLPFVVLSIQQVLGA